MDNQERFATLFKKTVSQKTNLRGQFPTRKRDFSCLWLVRFRNRISLWTIGLAVMEDCREVARRLGTKTFPAMVGILSLENHFQIMWCDREISVMLVRLFLVVGVCVLLASTCLFYALHSILTPNIQPKTEHRIKLI